MYQLRRHRDVSAWSGAFRLVTKINQFLLCTISVNFIGVSDGSISLRYQLVSCYNVSKTSFSFRYQLWRLCDVFKGVSLTYVPVIRSLRPLKLVGFIYVPVRRRKDVSNRSVSLTYQLRRRDDVLAWSATSRPIWDLNEMSLWRRMPGGVLFQNQVEWILPAFFSWHDLYANGWSSWPMLSDMKRLPENFSWRRSPNFFRRFFLLTSTLRISFRGVARI